MPVVFSDIGKALQPLLFTLFLACLVLSKNSRSTYLAIASTLPWTMFDGRDMLQPSQDRERAVKYAMFGPLMRWT